jgi:N utilization substance protein A
METILQAIEQICQEKKISKELVLSAIEQALASAYRRDYGNKNQNLKVEFNPESGSMRVFDIKTVVEDVPTEEGEKEVEGKKLKTKKGKEKKEKTKKKKDDKKEEIKTEITTDEIGGEETRRFNPRTEIQLAEAKKDNKKIKVGEIVKTELPMPTGFGRVAAQTAKQVIVQRLREAERQTVFERYKSQEGQVINGVVQRRQGNMVLIDLDEITALLPASEQIMEENYFPGQKLKFFLQVVRQGIKGAEIIVSRRHPDVLRELFRQEIPEIANEAVEIKALAREAGSRSKVAVWTKERGIDPVGACIGQRGVRIQTIISELGGEKIDVIEWSEDIKKFVANALSPAKAQLIELDEKNKTAVVMVPEDKLSLAIGRGGQNIRLASRLAGYNIEVKGAAKEEETKKEEEVKDEDKKNEETVDEKPKTEK